MTGSDAGAQAREDLVGPHRRDGTLTGQCLCGDVRIVVEGKYIAAIGVCHCSMCQRWSGMAFGSFVAEAAAVRITGPVTTHASSGFAERGFCQTCGSPVFLRNTDPAEDEIELMPGLFAAAKDFVLLSEIYVDRAPHYLKLEGAHATRTRAEYEAKNQFVEGDTP